MTPSLQPAGNRGVGPRISLIHATEISVGPAHAAMRSLWPAAMFTDLLDTSLSLDRDLGEPPEAFDARILTLARHARSSGAEAILFTCSAFGPSIAKAAAALDIPVLKPNQAMFEAALGFGGRIAMVATFRPAIGTMEEEFASSANEMQPGAVLETFYAAGALAALQAGDRPQHDRLVCRAVAALSGFDAIMLAHFSTSPALKAAQKLTVIPVLSAPSAAVGALKLRLSTADDLALKD